MNEYQKEQLETLTIVRRHLDVLPEPEVNLLKDRINDYLAFRNRVAGFLGLHFQAVCTATCYQDQLSACCSKDGIITFFADVAINAMISDAGELDRLENVIRHPENSAKCIYLTKTGCQWRLKPIVCEMFLCDRAENSVFGENQNVDDQWRELRKERKTFTWPDKPVLFELIEAAFISAGCDSPLMYIHKSPGLRKIREKRKME